VEVAGIESAPPNCLQDYEIIIFNLTLKNTNGTGVMGQVCQKNLYKIDPNYIVSFLIINYILN